MKKLSVILPCLNEEASIGKSIETIQSVFKKNNLSGEIIVVDNNSTDKTAEIAKNYPVVYILEKNLGYGNAYKTGFKQAINEIIIMGDPDGTYDFNEIPNFLKELDNSDFVLGNRFNKIEKNAMPFLHRYIGNPILRFMFHHIYGLKTQEVCTGFVALKKETLEKINPQQPGMEFSSELIIKAKKNNLKIKEVPITYHKRKGKSKLKTIKDGLRHIRYILSPK